MTSLSEQLKRLAVPQTTNLKRDKKRASLLFDPKEAATLTKETVYQIGIDGFEELKEKNPHFAPFEKTLFHLSSKDFERSVQTVEANDKLDKNIKLFLQLLSPYFPLSCAHKALEWLIHRYYIQDYNKNDLIILILPYLETNTFVRVLQLIKIRNNDRWAWLKPLQKPGIHLPRETLFNYAANTPSFLQFISDNLLSALREVKDASCLNGLFNFYCITFIGAIEFSQNITEEQVTQMTPSILEGIKSELPDFCVSAYGITTRLLIKTKLSDELLIKLVEGITKMSVVSLRTEAILTLLVLYQTQDQFSQLSLVAVKNIAQRHWLVQALQLLVDEGNSIDMFLMTLMKRTVQLALEEVSTDVCRKFMNHLLSDLKLEEKMICHLIRFILDAYDLNMSYPPATKNWLKDLMSRIEKLDPSSFDREVSKIMKKSSDEQASKEQIVFQRIIESMSSVDDDHAQYLLFEKLYHPSPDIRKSAIKSSINQYRHLKDRQQDFIRNALIDRLNDDDTQVVKVTLEMSSKVITDIVPDVKLRSVMIDILRKGRKESNWKLIHNAVKLLCKVSKGDDVEVLLAILPFLLPTNGGAFHTAQIVSFEQYLIDVAVLEPSIVDIRFAKSHEKIFTLVYQAIKGNQTEIDYKLISQALAVIPKEDTLCIFLAALLLCNNLPKSQEIGDQFGRLKIILDIMKSNRLKPCKKQGENNYITMAHNKKMPLQGILTCIGSLIRSTKGTSVPLGEIDFYSETDEGNFILLLLDLLLKGVFNSKLSVSKAYAETTETFFIHFCENFEAKISFLLNIVISRSNYTAPSMQLRSVRTVHAILSNEKKITRQFIDAITPSLIAALNNEHAEIRNIVLETLEVLIPHCAAIRIPSYSLLIQEVVSSKQEILMDAEQAPWVVYNALNEKKLKSAEYCIKGLVAVCGRDVPIYLKSGIMKVLSLFKTTEIYSKFATICCQILQDTPDKLHSQHSMILRQCITQFDGDVAESLKLNTPMWTFIELALRNDKAEVKLPNNFTNCPSVLIMQRFDQELYAQLKPDVQNVLLDIVVKMATNSQNPDLLSAASKIFKHIDLDASSIEEHLIKMRDVLSPKLDVNKRKRRMSVVPTLDILDTKDWKEGLTVLEFLQDKKKIRNIDKLLPLLFNILKKCLDFDEQTSVEYPKQLLLSAILHYCDRMDVMNLPKNLFNMELIVQCVRASQNPQTHYHALLLLSRVASFAPNQVLHHTMAIFTFMGSSVLRHDDAYSFQIITKIIETIIPILVKSNQNSTASVLRVFVDVLLDVPEHRRLPLYKKLLEQVGVMENLYIFLLLVFEAHVTHPSAEKMVNSKVEDVPKRLDVATNLCGLFSPEEIIFSCIKLIEYLKQLPEDKEDYSETDPVLLVFNLQQHTPKQFRHYKYTLVTFTSSLLASKELVNQIACLSEDDSVHMETVFKNMIINILMYIQTTTKIAERNANTRQAQYWKIMLHHSYDILDSLNALLTSQMFLLVIKGLMTHTLKTVKRRALELLNSKIQHDPDFFKECDDNELYAMLPLLINIIKCVEEDLDSDQEVVVQTALLSLKLFVRLLAPRNPEKFTPILHYVTDIVKSGKIDVNITASAILCLSELCSNLRAHAIPSLDKFMPSLVKVLKLQQREKYPSLLLLSTLTALQKIFDCLSLFLSPYLEKLLCELSSLGSLWSPESDDPKIIPFVSKLSSIKQKIGTNIPLRVLLPAINSSFDTLIAKKKYQSVKSLMDILSESLSSIKGAELQNNISDMTTLFLNALQFRTENGEECPDCNEVEANIIKALSCLILKLSENTFRPLYYKLYDWAIRSNAKSERIITFYALSNQIAASLKGLFVLFAGHFIQNAATILESCNSVKNDDLYFEGEESNVLLLENVLKTLNLVCTYDGQKFINKERFDVLMQPIADQLENNLGNFEVRARQLVIPCIVNFAVAIADDSLWKQLNYQILLKMRDSNMAVRLIGLECLREVAKKLGEDFLPLLPETIPFLAELLEDEEETVEKACQKVVQELETVLGEPLQKYF